MAGPKNFPVDFTEQTAVLMTDKLIIQNVTTGVTQYCTVAELLATVLTNPTLAGTLTMGGARPIIITSGSIIQKGEAGGWSIEYKFNGSANTALGGFGAVGVGDVLSYFYIGTYANPNIKFYADGTIEIFNTITGIDKTMVGLDRVSNVTISSGTADPTGGLDGDIYLQY
jgi:hypothetical protein